MKNLKPLALVAAIAIFLFACQKSGPAISGNSLLVRNWKQTDLTLTVNGATQSIFSQQSVCKVDNIYSFSANNKFAVTEGATKCSPSDADTAVAGTWSLVDNNTKLSLTDGSGPHLFVVETLTGSELVLSDTATVRGLLTKGTLYFQPQ
jgi:Lipocalin-like domain